VDCVLEVRMDLARVVADTQLADARQALQLVLVEDVADVVLGHVASVVPRLPEQPGQQRAFVRRVGATAAQSSRKLHSHRHLLMHKAAPFRNGKNGKWLLIL